MRLNQLAKKVGKPYTRIEKFLIKECGMTKVEGPNTKLSNDIVDKVIYKFGLAEDNKSESSKKTVLKTVEAIEAEISPEEKGIEESEISFDAPTPAESVKPVIELDDVKMSPKETDVTKIISKDEEISTEDRNEAISETSDSNDSESNEEGNINTVQTGETTLHIDKEGVVKAPKVELEGIKVMGKINLPKPKVVEDPEIIDSKEEEESTNVPSKPKKSDILQDEIDLKRTKRLEAKKKAERESIEKEYLALRKKEKEAKKQYYAQQEKSPPKTVKKKSSKVSQKSEDNKAFETKEKYKIANEDLTLFQKLIKWFNT